MQIERRMIPQYGITLDGVWLPYRMLEALSDQGPWDSQYGMAFIEARRDQERVLLEHGLAVKETKGGLHRSDTLADFLAAIEWPQEEPEPPPAPRPISDYAWRRKT